VDIFWLAPRRRIGALQRTVEAIPIQRSGLNILDDSFMIPAPSPGQRDEALGWGQQMDLNRL
jgi:hypothetical protein